MTRSRSGYLANAVVVVHMHNVGVSRGDLGLNRLLKRAQTTAPPDEFLVLRLTVTRSRLYLLFPSVGR